jgi:hypothetical protein
VGVLESQTFHNIDFKWFMLELLTGRHNQQHSCDHIATMAMMLSYVQLTQGQQHLQLPL